MQRVPIITFITANLISIIGNNLTMIAIPWFVLETTGSAFQTGLVAFFTTLPAIMAAFFGGTFVDRIGSKRMSIISDLASGATVAFIPLLHITIGLQFWQLLILVFLSALLDAPGYTARQALLPDLARAANMSFEQANAAQQAVSRAGTLIGPAAAGLLIVWLGSSNVLWLDAASFAISAGLFALAIPSKQQKNRSEKSYFDQLREGLHFVRQDRLILMLILTVTCTNFLDAPVFAVVLPVYAERVFGQATALGLMVSSFGAGALIGSLLFGTITRRLPRRITFVVSFILVSVPFWVLSLEPTFPLTAALLLFGGLAAGQINPIIMTTTQERIPPDLRGRVFGIMTALALVATPLGMMFAGFLTEVLGVTVTLIVIGTAYLLVTAAQIFNPVLHAMDTPSDLSFSKQALSKDSTR